MSENKAIVLKSIITDFGFVWTDIKRFKAILMDYYPNDCVFRNIVIQSVSLNIPDSILKSNNFNELDKNRLSLLLVNTYGCTKKNAREVVDAWTSALVNEKKYQKELECVTFKSSNHFKYIDFENDVRFMTIEDLQFNHRIHRALSYSNILTVRQLLDHSVDSWYRIRSLGKISVEDIIARICKEGIDLNVVGNDPFWIYPDYIKTIIKEKEDGWVYELFIELMLFNLECLRIYRKKTLDSILLNVGPFGHHINRELTLDESLRVYGWLIEEFVNICESVKQYCSDESFQVAIESQNGEKIDAWSKSLYENYFRRIIDLQKKIDLVVFNSKLAFLNQLFSNLSYSINEDIVLYQEKLMYALNIIKKSRSNYDDEVVCLNLKLGFDRQMIVLSEFKEKEQLFKDIVLEG